jgi:hypothetical protein
MLTTLAPDRPGFCNAKPAPARRPALRVEDDGHWPVVDELELHPGTEHPRLDVDALRAQRFAEVLVQRFGLFLRCRIAEIRPSSLLASAICDQGELADDDGFAAGVEHAAIESALVVLEDPQSRDLPGEPVGRCKVVAAGHAKEHAEPGVDLGHDLVPDEHTGECDALDDRLQSRTRRSYVRLWGRSERASL